MTESIETHEQSSALFPLAKPRKPRHKLTKEQMALGGRISAIMRKCPEERTFYMIRIKPSTKAILRKHTEKVRQMLNQFAENAVLPNVSETRLRAVIALNAYRQARLEARLFKARSAPDGPETGVPAARVGVINGKWANQTLGRFEPFPAAPDFEPELP